jgi:phosphate transport system substrate-binding protein
LVEARLFVPLEVRLRTKVLDLLAQVQCNQRAALDTSYVVGAGPSLPVFTAWAVDQSTSKTTIKYYEATSLQAKQQLASLDEHFGATVEGIEPSWFDSVPDLAVVPAAAYAIGPVYHLAELGSEELVLDVETIASIYLGNITRWNDERIRAINSAAVRDLLPEQDIVVVTPIEPSEITLLFTTMLSAKDTAFAQQVLLLFLSFLSPLLPSLPRRVLRLCCAPCVLGANVVTGN